MLQGVNPPPEIGVLGDHRLKLLAELGVLFLELLDFPAAA
ncbi:MAG: hypothetical protein GMKNLPBB_02095 [Myxococcota bacterium]|nr:hypothetical protein [Myxococcota bacterium]